MSKKHHKKRQKRNSDTVQPKAQALLTGGGWLSAIKIFWSIIVIISVIISFLVLWPRLTVTPGEPVDKTNPFYTPFILSNDGFLPIKDIKFVCGLKKVNLQGNNLIKNSSAELSNISVPSLDASESTSIRFNWVFNREAPILFARIEVFVSYKAFLLPLRFEKKQQFETQPDSSGNLFWMPVAASVKVERVR